MLSVFRGPQRLYLVVCLTLACVAAAAAADDSLLAEGIAHAARGQFDQAYLKIDRLFTSGHVETPVKEVHRWLEEFERLQRLRRELTRADYEKYCGWVRDHAEKKQWSKATDDLYRAFLNCEDPDAFRKEAWVQDTVRHAMEYAAGLREKGEWMEAIRIYGALTEIFEPDSEPYRKLRQQCRTHILLEETYRPSGEWKEGLRDIDPDMARNAIPLIAERYVSEPDFRKIARGGLERLVLLASTRKLTETFPAMKDADLVQEFSRRLASRIRRIEEDDRVTPADAVEAFNAVMRINRETLQLPTEVVVAEFMEGAMETLDEFSSMIWPAEVDQFRKDTMGEFFGVGIQISIEDGFLKVISPLEDTPAYEAGIQPGDIITKVNGESTKGISIDQAVRRITGPAGTRVVLTIRRNGDREFDVGVTRDRIVIHTVKGLSREPSGEWNYWADPERKIAYIRVTGFQDNTVDDLVAQLGKLRQQGLRGLILDLRFNPGGLLKSAVDMCDVFLPPGKRIVSTKGRDSKEWEMSSSRREGADDVPLIVLVNDFSASASEIVSGAIQDYHRGLILGERTFGKGLVQNLEMLGPSGNSYIKLTTAKYYLPNGRCIQKEPGSTTWGVDPNVPLKLCPKETRKVLEMRRRGDVLKGKDQKELPADLDAVIGDKPPATAPSDDEPEDKNDRPEIDPQYEAALLLMRVRILTNQPWPFETEPVTARASTR